MGNIIDFPGGDKPKTDEDLTEEEKRIEEEKEMQLLQMERRKKCRLKP